MSLFQLKSTQVYFLPHYKAWLHNLSFESKAKSSSLRDIIYSLVSCSIYSKMNEIIQYCPPSDLIDSTSTFSSCILLYLFILHFAISDSQPIHTFLDSYVFASGYLHLLSSLAGTFLPGLKSCLPRDRHYFTCFGLTCHFIKNLLTCPRTAASLHSLHIHRSYPFGLHIFLSIRLIYQIMHFTY